MDRSRKVRTIGHDDFDPVGTLALVALYFVVLTLMWLFTYFVEFLGNAPTVVGGIAPLAAQLAREEIFGILALIPLDSPFDR